MNVRQTIVLASLMASLGAALAPTAARAQAGPTLPIPSGPPLGSASPVPPNTPLPNAPTTPNGATSGAGGNYNPGTPLGNNGLPTTPRPRPLRVGVGVLFATDDHVQTDPGSKQFVAGATLDLVEKPRRAAGVYVDGSALSHNGSHFNLLGVGVSGRVYLLPVGPYVGLGVGGYEADYKDPSRDGSDFGLGGKVFLGYDAPGGGFFETNYTRPPEVKGRNLGNVQVEVGYRF